MLPAVPSALCGPEVRQRLCVRPGPDEHGTEKSCRAGSDLRRPDVQLRHFEKSVSLPRSGRLGDNNRIEYDNLATNEKTMAAEGLGLRLPDTRGSHQPSLALDRRPPSLATHSVQNNIPAHRILLGPTSSVRTPSTSPTRLPQQLLEYLASEKRALKVLESGLDEVKQRLEAKIPHRRSLPPETAVSLRYKEVLELLECVAQSQEERAKLFRLAESREGIIQKSVKGPSGAIKLSPRLPDSTERSFERGISPYPRVVIQDARPDMLSELRALESLRKDVQMLGGNLEEAEKRQRQWKKAGLGEDPDISEEIQELRHDIGVKQENIDRLEHNVAHFQEILDGQEDEPPSETSSVLGPMVDSERISKWQEAALLAAPD